MTLAMRIHVLQREQLLSGRREAVFAFFADAFNLEAITPPLLHFRMLTRAPVAMGAGTVLRYRLRLHGVPVVWQTLIREWEPGVRFVDVQLRGPYRLWHHTHEFADAGDGRTRMRDTVRYAVGFGALGELADRVLVRRDLDAIFDHRARAVPALLRLGRDEREAVEDEVGAGEVAR
jgi:ligand-binding SRPBCC domain-containing protein